MASSSDTSSAIDSDGVWSNTSLMTPLCVVGVVKGWVGVASGTDNFLGAIVDLPADLKWKSASCEYIITISCDYHMTTLAAIQGAFASPSYYLTPHPWKIGAANVPAMLYGSKYFCLPLHNISQRRPAVSCDFIPQYHVTTPMYQAPYHVIRLLLSCDLTGGVVVRVVSD